MPFVVLGTHVSDVPPLRVRAHRARALCSLRHRQHCNGSRSMSELTCSAIRYRGSRSDDVRSRSHRGAHAAPDAVRLVSTGSLALDAHETRAADSDQMSRRLKRRRKPAQLGMLTTRRVSLPRRSDAQQPFVERHHRPPYAPASTAGISPKCQGLCICPGVNSTTLTAVRTSPDTPRCDLSVVAGSDAQTVQRVCSERWRTREVTRRSVWVRFRAELRSGSCSHPQGGGPETCPVRRPGRCFQRPNVSPRRPDRVSLRQAA